MRKEARSRPLLERLLFSPSKGLPRRFIASVPICLVPKGRVPLPVTSPKTPPSCGSSPSPSPSPRWSPRPRPRLSTRGNWSCACHPAKVRGPFPPKPFPPPGPAFPLFLSEPIARCVRSAPAFGSVRRRGLTPGRQSVCKTADPLAAANPTIVCNARTVVWEKFAKAWAERPANRYHAHAEGCGRERRGRHWRAL